MKKNLTLGFILLFSVTLLFSMAFARDNSDDAWMGVTTQTIDDELADAFDLDINHGVIVNMVFRGSPADDAGIQEDDIIIAFNSEKIYDYDDLINNLEDSSPKEKISVTILRDDKNITLEITLGNTPKRSSRNYWGNRTSRNYIKIPPIPPISAIPSLRGLVDMDDFDWADQNHFYSYDNSNYIGVQLSELSDQLREYFGIRNDDGVLITEVDEDSPAEDAGLLAGDIIIAADNMDIEDYRDIKEAINDKDDGDNIKITVIRNKSNKQFDVTIAEHRSNHKSFFNSQNISVHFPQGNQDIAFFSDDFDGFEGFGERMEELAKELDHLKFDLKHETFEQLNSNEFKSEMKKFKRDMKNELRIEEEINMKELKSQLKKMQKEMQELEQRIDE